MLDKKRFCRQCGKQLPDGVRFNVIICSECRKSNEVRKNREKNKQWYLKHKEEIKVKRAECYKEKHKKKEKPSSQYIDGTMIRKPTKQEVNDYVDRLIRDAEERERMFERRELDYESKYIYDIIDSPYGPVCSNPHEKKRSYGVEDKAPKTYSESMVNGREMVIETRGRACGGAWEYGLGVQE